MRTYSSKWPLLLSVFALTLTVAIGLNFNTNVLASGGGNDLGTSPFDFSDAAYRAQGIVPENIVLRVGTAACAGDFVVDNTNTDPNRTNIRTIETTPGTTGSSGLTYANIFGVLNSTSFERTPRSTDNPRTSSFDTAERFRVFIFPKVERLDPRSISSGTNGKTTSSIRAMATSLTIR